jgi:hypothetical protein
MQKKKSKLGTSSDDIKEEEAEGEHEEFKRGYRLTCTISQHYECYIIKIIPRNCSCWKERSRECWKPGILILLLSYFFPNLE